MKKPHYLREYITVPLAVLALGAFLHPAEGKDGGKEPAAQNDQRGGGEKSDAQKIQPVPVIATPVALQTLPRQLKVIGTAIPFQSVALTARINSQIVAVKFNAGDPVRAGQVMFQLDDRTIRANLTQAQAALQGDQAQILSLQRQYERTQQGLKKGFFSEAERDSAKAALDAKKAAVEADKAAVENLKVQLDYTTVTAPIDGRTGTINYTVGNIVPANGATPLVTINQVEPISVQVSLPQDSFDAVRAAMAREGASASGDTAAESAAPAGVPVFATRTGTKAVIEGRLDYIDNTIDAATGTFAARASFANQSDLLWPGMLVSITINLDQGTPSIVIPSVAVQHDQAGNSFVYTVEDGKAHKGSVKIDRQQDGVAMIAEGLKQGDVVVTDGMMALRDGGPVTVTQPKNKAEDADANASIAPAAPGTADP